MSNFIKRLLAKDHATRPTISWMARVMLQDFNKAPEDAQDDFRSALPSELIQYHHTLGKDIRNKFHLWNYKWTPQLENGIDMSPEHPDAVSMRVINLLHQLVQND